MKKIRLSPQPLIGLFALVYLTRSRDAAPGANFSFFAIVNEDAP